MDHTIWKGPKNCAREVSQKLCEICLSSLLPLERYVEEVYSEMHLLAIIFMKFQITKQRHLSHFLRLWMQGGYAEYQGASWRPIEVSWMWQTRPKHQHSRCRQLRICSPGIHSGIVNSKHTASKQGFNEPDFKKCARISKILKATDELPI